MKYIKASERLPEFKKTVFIKDMKDSKYVIMDVGELQKEKNGELYFSGTSRSYPVNHEKYDVYWLDETPTIESQWPTEEAIEKAAVDWLNKKLISFRDLNNDAEDLIKLLWKACAQWLRSSGVREGTREGEATNKRNKLDGIWDGPDVDPDDGWEESFP